MSDVSNPTPSEPVVQQAAPMEMQSKMEDSLSRALGKLSAMEMPVKRGEKRVKEEVAPEPSEAVERQVESTSSQQAAAVPPLQDTAPPPPQAPAWGPAQQQALQQILSANQSMEAELRAAREERDRYRGIVESAQVGDMDSFTQQAQVSQADLLESLNGKGAVTRPHVRKLEGTVQTLQQKLAAMEKQLAERDQAEKTARELANITEQLNVKPDYAIFKKIPDAAARVQALIQKREAEARDRGEVASLTVDQAAALLKSQIVGSLKQLIEDDAVKRELGLMGESATPANATPRPSKAITGKMSSSGSIQRTTQGYNPDEQLRRALSKVQG